MKRSFYAVLAATVIFFIYVLYLAIDLPTIEQLENYDPDLVTRIYAADGQLLNELFFEKRVFVNLDQIPQHMLNATVAKEDQRFYDHWGISMRDVIRAIVINTATMSYRSGFSSLTQQLARNLYDNIGFKKTITRKIKEVITAIQIERTYTKDEILEMYLNSVHFGHGTYGVQAASKRFFDKEARDLTLAESALLVGLLPAPARYSPVRYPERALTKRNLVLRVMRDQNYINPEEYAEACARSLENVHHEQPKGAAPYFTEYIRRFLEREDDGLGVNIYRDGLKIYTTLDACLQTIAEDVILSTVRANQNKLNNRLFSDEEEFSKLAYLGIHPKDTVKMMMSGELELYVDLRSKLLVQSAFIALNPRSGAILAMVGGRPDYPDQFNRATQSLRQPGSVFKPFVYTTAIDNGVPITKQLLNQPVVLNVRNALGEWVKWMPQNYDGSTGGLTTIREGLRRSLNLISVRMVQEVVPAQAVKQTAKRMGISTDIRAVDAIALGTSEVHLLEMVAAYGTFANKGVYCKPFGITRIEDRYGNVLKEYFPQREEVLSAETSYMMTSLLQTVLDRGTGGSARWKFHFYHPAAGKTGTTQGWTDAWFVGYSPYIAAGAWFGVDDPQVSLGPGSDGSKAALPAWAQFMRASHDSLHYEPKEFQKPGRVVEWKICRVTKDKSNGLCPEEKELFIVGTEPVKKCSVH